MRHLSVPKRQTQSMFLQLAERGWLAPRARVLEAGEERLLPLSEEAPAPLPAPFEGLEEVDAEQPAPFPRRWLERLPQWVSEEEIKANEGYWPNAQEPLGDLLLFKLEKEIRQYAQEIALAKLAHHRGVRAAFWDRGVEGEFRVRNLEPLAARHDGEVIGRVELDSLEPDVRTELLSTRSRVREHGVDIDIDPGTAFFSHRLQTERFRTVDSALALKERLGRPIAVADPYCGVGPALAHMLAHTDLIGDLLASDLNPKAVELLLVNLARKGVTDLPDRPEPLSEVSPGRFVGIADALTLADDPALAGRFDLLLINLPHDTLRHLPHLLPLLRRRSTSLVRGWVVAAEDDMDEINAELMEVLRPLAQGAPPPILELRRPYNVTEWLCRFEGWLELST